MSVDIVAAAKALAVQFDAEPNTRAYHDPAEAFANRPCLLVLPPTLNYLGVLTGDNVLDTITWRVLAVSSHAAMTLDALKEIQKLLPAVRNVVEALTSEVPARYSFGPDGKNSVATYICTATVNA